MSSDYAFHTKVVGVTFEGRQKYVARLNAGESLKLIREPYNKHDSNAIAVYNSSGNQLGYINKDLAAQLANQMDRGVEFRAVVSGRTGGDAGQSYGANIFIQTHRSTVRKHNEDTKKIKVWDF